MSVTLPLDTMTVPEKLQVMEAIWTDLTRNADEIESPSWHGELLAERERRITSGEARFTDWETAKKEIRNRLA